MIDCSKFVENSRKWLKKYIQDNHLQSIVIGVSGGIDSAVSCAIASPVCKELGIPLIGRCLTCHSNNPEENSSANLVGLAFCTDYKIISIEELYAQIAHMFELNEGKLTKLQLGNIKARLRMIYLRNLASVHKGVVLDNDNFTEWNLGFWTVGGDSPMDVNLGLHYLWKTEVYELANFLLEEQNQSDRYQALLASTKLIPTDGNGVSKSDCEQFGLDNYEQVDDVLQTMYYRSGFDQAFSPNEDQYIRLIDEYNEQGVDKVMMLHQNTAYKRKELPIKPTRKELGL